ncbi:GNAT family N-acetyltransferase [Mucilaginibacter rubeus]|uniref:GNAT family N-acetyltransferase n=1 Tax=Mucilaginibacter rubeus TaxID=2027860 RepID=A0A5C1HZF7_9SPHI|nr:GNAT family N-acetyltransferase [Mucilaginibacter rubeus]QEM11065.1 GNAT family N-acetyltransferase [Mucilaginibacter rubeus]
MEHVLDNPAWNALNTGNRLLAGGNDIAKYFPKEISPFVGIPEVSAENFNTLYGTIPFESYFIFIAPHDIVIPEQWTIVNYLKCLQMVFEGEIPADFSDKGLLPLTEQHVPQMIELTQLTNPGPFIERTIEFGHYHGIFDGDKLVAMAGQRLNPTPYAEISAVCTHPDYLGRGYAGKLLLNQAKRIKAASGIPFLHVKSENERAIKVYEKLGFVTRKEMSFYVLKK